MEVVSNLCGCNSVVEYKLPKLGTRVRSPSSAPLINTGLMALCHEPIFCSKNLKKTLLEIKRLIVNHSLINLSSIFKLIFNTLRYQIFSFRYLFLLFLSPQFLDVVRFAQVFPKSHNHLTQLPAYDQNSYCRN